MKNYLRIALILVHFSLLVQGCAQKQEHDQSTADPVKSEAPRLALPASDELYELIEAVLREDSTWPWNGTRVRLLDSLPADSFAYDFLIDKYWIPEEERILLTSHWAELQDNRDHLRSYRLDSAKLSGPTLLHVRTTDFYAEDAEENMFLVIASPLFFDDNQQAVVAVDFICQGLCGEGWSIILNRERGKWVKVGRFMRWIS
ncbi:hypothetical protein SAMN05421823_11332 [Catalinimonas alkaloidigena]|uniref:Lipoprotein n=1 Tax=Catalinimonas alkaloidigena TaxID=1075417 RepID=A0A1G9SYE5_9BACT|nr:hypothetical protein [Catalinimonas alkaloidigena]SDM40444.1 hypothetical protein SAMN05421823_11332 [Catalinimonas alkaloidigena]